MEDVTGNESLHTIAPLPFDLDDGRDELNLAEFPLAAIADRVPGNQKTLVFEDKIFDSGKSEMITRRLTISASDKYGLPTSLDSDVVLGLIQLSRKNRFADRKLNFSRYELIQEMRWRHEGRSYARLEKSLKRWLGVTLYYDKAWWDKDAQSWVDEHFHILEQVTLYDQERRLKRLRSTNAEPPLSSFTWNEVLFRSFKSGYLKSIDLGVYHRLEYAAAKRMFRFLDKRFYHKSRWEFDLTEFACEHIGVSRNYDTGQLKRRLQPAIKELEAVGFLEALPTAQRFVKISRGQWKIIVVRKSDPEIQKPTSERAELLKPLLLRGVTPSVAAQLVRDYPEEVIRAQLKALEELLAAKDRNSIRNPGGFIVRAIREGYVHKKASSVAKGYASPVRQVVPPIPIDPLAEKVESYLESLSAAELEVLESQALKAADVVVADGYHRSKKRGGQAFQAYRRMLLTEQAKRELSREELLLKKTA